VAVLAAVTGSEVLMAHSQFRHYTKEDAAVFFTSLLKKLNDKYPGKGFTFIGDNEGIWDHSMELFRRPENRHHTLKAEVHGQQYRTLGDLLNAIQRAFEKVQPSHLLNYHKTVDKYLLMSIKKEPIHSWRIKLGADKTKTTESPKQKWDVRHRTIFATEKDALNKPMVKDNQTNPPKPDKATMIVNGVDVAMYP